MRLKYSDYIAEHPDITAKGARRGDYPCFYCGQRSSSIDHFIPQAHERSVMAFIDIGGDQSQGLENLLKNQRFIPACRECNSLASDGMFDTPDEKKSFVKAKLRKRYHKVLDIPNWSDKELSELDYTLRISVESGVKLRDLIGLRLQW